MFGLPKLSASVSPGLQIREQTLISAYICIAEDGSIIFFRWISDGFNQYYLSHFFSSHLSYNLGSPLDFSHTPATRGTERGIITMALSSAASSNKVQTQSPHSSTSPFNLLADWTQKLPTPSEWAVISLESITSSQPTASNEATRCEKAAASTVPLLPSRVSLTEDSWHERDSGLGPQAMEEGAGEEVNLVLFSLMEHYRASLGLSPNTDPTTGAIGMFFICTVHLQYYLHITS